MAKMPGNIYIEARSPERGSFGYEIFFKSIPSGTLTTPHFHDVIEIIYVKKGGFFAYANTVRYELHAGSLLVFRSREIHGLIPFEGGNTDYYCIKIDPAILRDALRSENDLDCFFPFISGKPSDDRLFEYSDDTKDVFLKVECLTDEFCGNEYAKDISLYAKCLELLISLLRYWNAHECTNKRQSGISVAAMYKALEYIQLHYNENITALDCSQYVALSYSQFSRTFKRVFGMSFPMYLSVQRCSFAEKLLLTTDMRISEISDNCGFSDTAYFIKQFKARYGKSPAKYRTFIKNELNQQR